MEKELKELIDKAVKKKLKEKLNSINIVLFNKGETIGYVRSFRGLEEIHIHLNGLKDEDTTFDYTDKELYEESGSSEKYMQGNKKNEIDFDSFGYFKTTLK